MKRFKWRNSKPSPPSKPGKRRHLPEIARKSLMKRRCPISANPSSMIRTLCVLRSFSAPPHSFALLTYIGLPIKVVDWLTRNSQIAKILNRFKSADKFDPENRSLY
jgi:hypothetical protein